MEEEGGWTRENGEGGGRVEKCEMQERMIKDGDRRGW